MKHLLKLGDLSREEILGILNLADQLKYERKHGIAHPLLKGKTGNELLEYVRQSLSQREPFYKKADYELSVETLSVEESGLALAELLKKNHIL